MHADLELERASGRPADGPRGRIGEEDMRDEPHRQADDADAQHERIEQEDMDDAKPRPRNLADIKVHERQNHAQQRNGYGDHEKRISGG